MHDEIDMDRSKSTVIPLAALLSAALLGACGHVSSGPQIFPTDRPTVSKAPPAPDCEALGPLTAEADCACFDKMSYQRVEARASDNLSAAALNTYPETDVVQVSEVDLFLNNAVAHGVAFRCESTSGG